MQGSGRGKTHLVHLALLGLGVSPPFFQLLHVGRPVRVLHSLATGLGQAAAAEW